MYTTLYEAIKDPIKLLHDPEEVSDLAFALEDDEGVQIWVAKEDAEAVAQEILARLGKDKTARISSECSLNEALMRLAILHDKSVQFRYAKGDGSTIETRTLTPTQVIAVGNHLTFVGVDPDRDGPRAYRLDRVKGAVTIL